MWQDIRIAVRGFRQSPGFTLTALVTLTLAIGANAAVFSLINARLLRDADVRDPRSLVQVGSLTQPQGLESGLTYAMYDDFTRRQQVFSGVIGWRANGIYNIDTDDRHSRGLVAAVSGNFFDEVGARPAAGRLLSAADVNEPSAEPAMVAVLGHGLWRRAFGADPDVIGRRVAVEGVAFTVIGVAPPEFLGLGMYLEPAVTVPLTAFPKFAGHAPGSLRTSASTWVRVTGRLKPGVSIDQARAAVTLLWPALKAANTPASLQGARRDAFLAADVSVNSAATGIETGARMRARFSGAAIAAVGLAAGVLLALGSVNVMRSLIFGVTPYDITTIAAAVATLSAIATLACLFPALRVSKADPTSILRTP